MRTLRDGTFVHAYLITGLEGMGKRTLARLLAQYWLCQAPEGEKHPCGVCRACQQVRDGTHADLVIIAPGKPISPDVRPGMKSIPVDEIRALIAITGRHTFEGGRRVVLIEQADKMNPPAQNALLKTLEEPVHGTIFLLMTESPSLLLCHLGQRSESAVMPYPAAWQRFSREGELSAMMRLLDAVAQARQMRANQVTWQAVVERLLLSLMEEKSKWST